MSLLRTALYDSHAALGARVGGFAGYDMPLFYKAGALQEHDWTRSHCSVFDVSHMGQAMIEGPGAAAFLERITPSAFVNKALGRAQYTVLTNENGGIVDDLIVARLGPEKFFAVLNAGRKAHDMGWIKQHLPADVTVYALKNRALIAVQGPWAERIVHEALQAPTTAMNYMETIAATTVHGVPVLVSRLGYTGEDGFEISLPEDEAADLWNALIGHAEAQPAGLAARDTLRLEMGYPLYGHDIDETTTPLEAGLGWVVRKDNPNFIGADKALAVPQRVRVGLMLTEPGIAREGVAIVNAQGQKIGALTSGGFSPSLKKSIGMGYIPPDYAAPGTRIAVNVRGRDIAAEITPLPFVPAKTKTRAKHV